MKPTPSLPDRSHVDKKRSRTVVVGVDASESSWDAYWWSRGEAMRLGGKVVAVYVSPVAGLGTAMAAAAGVVADSATIQYDWSDQAASFVAEQLRSRLGDSAVDDVVDVEFVHTRGDPAAELLRIAALENADLIVVGKSSKALHHLGGSLGRRIIGKRNAPVVVVVP